MEGNRHQLAIYQRKAKAPTSFYFQEGDKNILPNRVCFTQLQFAPVVRIQYNHPVGQFKATFKINELSPYRNEKRSLHTNIYPLKSKPSIIGSGDIKGTDDLLIFEDQSGGTRDVIAIHIFPGCKFKTAEILQTYFK